MRHLPKRSLLLFTLVFILFSSSILFPHPIAANPQDVYYPDVQEMNAGKKDTRNAAQTETLVTGPDVNNYQLNASMYNLANMIACTDTDPDVCKPASTAVGQISLAMQSIYLNPPASFAWYARDVLANAGLVKPALAQGIGFAGLSPMLSLWKATRNIAYAVIILVMLAIGFMIIFRMKIDPKTVISIQAALPKIIITLVLITFSYAIVGFFIDVMYLSMYVIIDILVNSFGSDFIGAGNSSLMQSRYINGGADFLFGNITQIGVGSIGDFLRAFWVDGFAGVGSSAGIGIGGGIFHIFSMGTGFMTFGWGLLIPVFGSILLILLIFLALLFIWIRFLVILFNSYISLLIALVLGPLLLLKEAIPGKSAFGSWIKNIISNLIVFPTTAVILLFAWFIVSENNQNIWQPPYLAFGTGTAFNGFLALALLFMGPGLITKLKQSFKASSPVPMSAGSILAPFTGAAQTGMGTAQSFYYMKGPMEGITNLIKGKIGGSGRPHGQSSR